MSEELFDLRLKLTEESIDKYGSYLLDYAQSLCQGYPMDAESLYDEFWIHVLNKFKEEDILHVGFLRRKLYQRFVDAWRKMKRNPVIATDTLPDVEYEESQQADVSSLEVKKSFFADHPVNLTDLQKEALFLWAYEELTYEEIAERLGRPRSTIGGWVKLGRQAVIDHIENQ